MSESFKCKEAITAAFEEAALALGGVVAMYPIPDEAVWDLARCLDLIHQRVCGQFGTANGAPDAEPECAEHPAIAHLLTKLQRERPEGRRCPR